jgi:hypothetical protein
MIGAEQKARAYWGSQQCRKRRRLHETLAVLRRLEDPEEYRKWAGRSARNRWTSSSAWPPALAVSAMLSGK